MALDLLSRSAEALLHPLNQWTKSSKLSSPRGTMRTVNIHEAKTHLSRLVDRAAKGEPFIIAKAGIPMAKLVPLDDKQPKKFNFKVLKGLLSAEVAAALEQPLPDDVLNGKHPLDPEFVTVNSLARVPCRGGGPVPLRQSIRPRRPS